MGYFNINLLKCDQIKSHSNFLDIIGSFQILPHITLPTRLTYSSSTLRTDNIFLSQNTVNSLSGNLTIGISDHLP